MSQIIGPPAEISISAYARSREVAQQTLSNAIAAGHIRRLPSGKLDADEVDATWLVEHQARLRIPLAGQYRERALEAAIIDLAATRSALQRELGRLAETTFPREAAERAKDRRRVRLLAALDAFPAVCTPEMATALQRRPAAVRRVLLKFIRAVAADL